MYTYIFIVTISLLTYISYRVTKNLLNTFTVLVGPYLFIVPINNWYITKYGFFRIGDETIIMLLTGIICFFIGFIIASRKCKKNFSSFNFKHYNLHNIVRYVIIVECIVAIRFFYIIATHGLSFISTPDYEGILTKGILGHLFLTIYPLIPIIFLYWLENKKNISYLLTVIIGISLLFLTLVKYHVIGMFILLYLFSAINNNKYLKKGAVIIISLVCTIFILNYLFQFAINDTAYKVDNSYYLQHLWGYISGSLIYDNYIFEHGIRVGTDIFYKLGSFIFAPINMFLSLADITLFPHKAQGFFLLSKTGEYGNVCDAIGYLYPSKGFLEEKLLFIIIMISIGWIVTFIHNKMQLSCNPTLKITGCVLLTFFVFFSFFGTFYVTPVPWEILFWSYFIFKFFKIKQ